MNRTVVQSRAFVKVLVWLTFVLFSFLSFAKAQTRGPRVALLIAHNKAGKRAKPLRYAVSDAYKFRKVLIQVSGYQRRDIFLSLNQSATQVKRVFRRVKKRIRILRRRYPGRKVVLLVYYSGHARNGQFFLGRTSLPFTALRRFLKHSGASLRLALLDTCGSGRFLKTRGIKLRKKSFHIPYLNTHSTKGEAIITSTGDRENAYEDLKLRGGIFTHYIATGLRGAADRNRDGLVTLEEIYAFVYSRTINRTVFAHSGPQKPHFQNNIQGTGQVIISSLRKQLAKLHFRKQLKGQFFIWDHQRTLYAGFRKRNAKPVRLALRPGRYHIQWRYGKRIFSSRVRLYKDQIFYLGKKQGRLVYFRALTRRGSSPPSDASAWLSLEEAEFTSPLHLTLSGGTSSALSMGGQLAGGARLGLEGGFWAVQFGAWGFSLLFKDDNQQEFSSSQLFIDAQLAFGTRFQWGALSLFTGGYLGVGWLVQHLNVQPRSGFILLAGVLAHPTYWFSPSFGIVMPIRLGMEAGPKSEQWQMQFAWSLSLGFSLRL